MVKKEGEKLKQQVFFKVKNLRISKTENIYATEGNRNVFEAVFNFETKDWDGLAKTAVFENTQSVKEKRLLVEDKCDIPDSFFATSGVGYVSVFAGDFMVTNKVPIIIVNAGYDINDPQPEAANYFEQILRYFDATNKHIKEHGDLAERYAVGLDSIPESLKDNAKYYAALAEDAVIGIPGQVDDAKKDIDAYVAQKEEALKGEDGNVIFPHFKIAPPKLFLKNDANETKIDFRVNNGRLEYKWKEVL